MSDAPSPPSSSLSEPPNQPAERAEHSGEWVIIGLVFSLILFMTVTYGVAAYYLRGDDWLSLVAPYIRLTNSAFFGLAAFCGVDAWRKGRTGWWLYIGGGLIPILQWYVTIYWMVAGRKRPGKFVKWSI